MAAITVSAPAKLNLYLHILGKRTDGYHELESLVVFTSLADRLQLNISEKLSLEVEGEFAEHSGDVESNLVLKAARALQAKCGVKQCASIRLAKNIPVGAGLGGGSADAAAALRGLNELWQLGLSEDQLREIAVPLGADVAMCVASKPAIVRGIGEKLEPVSGLAKQWAVLAHPRVPLLTAEVYKHYKPEAQQGERNDLQRAAIAVRPEVAEVLLALETLLPSPNLVRMSGSGACCFALYANERDAQKAARMLREQQPKWWVAETAILT